MANFQNLSGYNPQTPTPPPQSSSVNAPALIILLVLFVAGLSVAIFVISSYTSPADPNAQPDSYEDILIRNQGVSATSSLN